MLIWYHGGIDRFSHKAFIYGSVTFLMVEINYSQVRIKVDKHGEMGSGYRWRVNKLSQQTIQQAELLGVNYRNSVLLTRKTDLINETVTTVMFVGIKGGGKCRTAGFDKRLCGHFNVQYPGKELQSGAQRAKAFTKSLLHSVNTTSPADSAIED